MSSQFPKSYDVEEPRVWICDSFTNGDPRTILCLDELSQFEISYTYKISNFETCLRWNSYLKNHFDSWI